MSKHSPGPWRWGWKESDGDIIADDSLFAGDRPMGFYDESGRRYDDGHKADRALIAKAPELLATLRELEFEPSVDRRCQICGGWDAIHAPDCRLAALLKELP